MGKTESSYLALTWVNSAICGEGAELDRVTPICNNVEQSEGSIHDRLKYVHVSCGFYNKRKLGEVLFEEGRSFKGIVMKRIISGEVEYAS
jgi:hypothetical protein